MAILHPTVSVVNADGQPVGGDAANLTLYVVTDDEIVPYTGTIWSMGYESGMLGSEVIVDGEYRVDVTQAGLFQKVIGSSSTSGAIVVPASWKNDPGLAGANTVTITVTDADDVVLEGVVVTVHNATQTDAGVTQTTDANGQAVFGLGDGSYKVVLRSTPAYAPANPYDLTVVAGANVLTCVVAAKALPVPTQPDALVFWGVERQIRNLIPFGASEVVITPLSVNLAGRVDSTGQCWFTGDESSVSTDGTGQWSFELARSIVDAGAHLRLRREWETSGGEAREEEIVVILDASKIVDDTLAISDLAVARD